ncbi:MAG: FAD-dependent monooxygenase [Phycisphaerales bacterium]|nr:FAD-dependent monooxygenase [Phycisphaerales bacterium]
MRIGIVGCGTAGPAAAMILARHGHSVTLFERAEALHPAGAGLLLQPSGLAVLEELGLRDEMERAGSVIRRMHATLPGGRTVLDLRYGDLRPDLYGVGIGRGALLGPLVAAAQSAGVELCTGVEVTSVSSLAERPRLAAGGRDLGAFDLVVIADGSRSALTGSLGIPVRIRPYAWGALWCIGRRAVDPSDPERATLRQVYQSTTTLIGTLPSGTLEDGSEAVSLFYSARTDRFESIRQGGLDAWRREVARLHPLGGLLAEQVREPRQLLPAAYREVIMPRWHAGRVVVLGDAAHALSPLLGMGANLGLLDARALAEAVERHGPQAGPAYSAARKDAIRAYQRMCRWMTPFFQSGARPLAWARDLTVPLLCRWGWSRRQGLLTVAGVKVGLFSATDLPLPFALREGREPIFAASGAE